MKFLASVILFAVPILGYADNASMRAYSGTTLEAMCRSLNITQEQFVQCYDQSVTSVVTPYVDQPAGGNSDLLSCLQQYNVDLTQDKLNQALAQYRPVLPNTGSK